MLINFFESNKTQAIKSLVFKNKRKYCFRKHLSSILKEEKRSTKSKET